MATEQLLQILKLDLQLMSTAYDQLLLALIDEAICAISGEGITLDLECSRDIGLVRMYAAWLYRARGLTDPEKTAMPRMLRIALNNRRVREVVNRADP